jgi:hypothetical protein
MQATPMGLSFLPTTHIVLVRGALGSFIGPDHPAGALSATGGKPADVKVRILVDLDSHAIALIE